MKFSEIVDHASALLRRKQRITYRTLRREFALDDDALEDLKFELIDGQQLAVDEDGKVLVWVGEGGKGETGKRGKGEGEVVSSQLLVVSSQPPVSYTPAHLAERIRAEQAALEARGATDGERKTITALFADLKGSTALIEGLDPEEARAIIDPALQLMMDAVHQYDGYVAQALWSLGYPDQALQRSRDAVTLAQELSHPHSQAFALCFAAELYQFRREVRAAQERAEALIALTTKQGFPLWLARGTIVQGWALAEQGQGEEGTAQIRQGLAAYRATGAEVWRAYHLVRLAEVYGEMGQTKEGLTALTEALATADKTGGRYYEAELYRIKGTLTLESKVESHKSQVEEAEECFLRAIEVAQKQQAKSLELRATMSLARLWQSQGKTAEARQLLAEIYGWFTEGFDTKDLQEARGLLDSLGSST